jgi:hypothetical protein
MEKWRKQMKTVGLMCVKDEVDLLPQVYPHIRELVDYLYVYEDGSQDDTWDYVKDADYAIRKVDDKDRLEIRRPNYHHIFEQVKKDFRGEEVWCFLTMGDRFFLNKKPRQLVEEAKEVGDSSIHGVQLDFLRHRLDPWTEENDPYPDLSNIRNLNRWVRWDEYCVVGFRMYDQLSYLKAKYPWPRNWPPEQKAQYQIHEVNNTLTVEMPFLEHQGRRTPKAILERAASGARPISSRKYTSRDYSSYVPFLETAAFTYLPYKVIPWIDNSTLVDVVQLHNADGLKDKACRRYFFQGVEYAAKVAGVPPRSDLL